MKRKTCIVIGGGITGLTTARQLFDSGFQVLVIDKGKGLGGRIASKKLSIRKAGEGTFDYGAQFFTVTNDIFRPKAHEWLAKGVVKFWAESFENKNPKLAVSNEPKYCGVTSMRDLSKALGTGLSIRTDTRVLSIERKNDRWNVFTDDHKEFFANYLVIATPLPEAMLIIKNSMLSIGNDLHHELSTIPYSQCISVMLGFMGETNVPEPGGIYLAGDPVAWITDHKKKGISPNANTVTIHASHHYSQANWEQPYDKLCNDLLVSSREYLPQDYIYWRIHKWRFSQPRRKFEKEFLQIPEHPFLYLAGDAFGGPTIEGAYVSGFLCGQDIIKAER